MTPSPTQKPPAPHEFTPSRRQFLRFLAGGAGAVALSGRRLLARSSQQPPNFVVFFTDDQGYQDLGCFGSPLIKTPVIDGMAQEGMRFTDFYVANPVCTPSRAALMTGCYPLRVGMNPPRGGANVLFPGYNQGLNPDEITIAEVLKTKGYATGCFGKWHLGDKEPFLPTNQGFDYYYGIPYSNDMRPTVLMRDTTVIEDPAQQETLTRRYTDETLAFIEKNRDRPFFCYVPYTMPHVPLHASEQFKGTSERGLYGDTIEEIDWNVGRVVEKLRASGLDSKTLVVFTSDNGPWLKYGDKGGSALPLRGGKRETWEGGMRVPCVMWWPGTIPSGKTCSELCTAMDLLPTFAGLAGIDLASVYPDNRVIDGHDISPLLRNDPGAETPYEAFLYFHSFGGLDAIRSGDWKYHLGRKALYNLKDDISEQDNLVDKYPELVKQLSDKANLMKREVEANRRPVGLYDQHNWEDTVHVEGGNPSHARMHQGNKTASLRITVGRNSAASGEVYDIHGRRVKRMSNVTALRDHQTGRGVYITYPE